MRISVDPHDIRLRDIVIFNPHDHVDIGIVGAPFDGATRGRPGARFAPRCIRDYLYSMTPMIYDADLRSVRIGDFGDAETFYGSIELNKEEIYRIVKETLARSDRIIVLGGDHSITEPSFRAFSEDKTSVGLIVFDAHLDLRELKEGTVSSGTVIGDILRSNSQKLSPRNLVYIGIRDFVNPGYYVEKARKIGAKIYKAIDILLNSPEHYRSLLSEALEYASDGVDAVYVSFDVDVLDGTFTPGLNAPSPLGLRPEHLVVALEFLGSKDVVEALDVTEVAPPYDPTGNTCKIVAVCVLSFIAGYARLKR